MDENTKNKVNRHSKSDLFNVNDEKTYIIDDDKDIEKYLEYQKSEELRELEKRELQKKVLNNLSNPEVVKYLRSLSIEDVFRYFISKGFNLYEESITNATMKLFSISIEEYIFKRDSFFFQDDLNEEALPIIDLDDMIFKNMKINDLINKSKRRK